MFPALKTPVPVLSTERLIDHGISAPTTIQLPGERVLLPFPFCGIIWPEYGNLLINLRCGQWLMMVRYHFPLLLWQHLHSFTSYCLTRPSPICHLSKIKAIIQNFPDCLGTPCMSLPILCILFMFFEFFAYESGISNKKVFRRLCPHPASRIRLDNLGNTANADRIRLGWNVKKSVAFPAFPFTGTG